MIFSRRSRAGRHAKADESKSAPLTPAERRRAERAAMLEELDLAGAEPAFDAPAATTSASGARQLPDGPFDSPDAPPAERVDLGSLLVPAVDGVEIRIQASDDGVVQQVVLGQGDSALQLGVFAAPRTEGMWAEVRSEIRKSLFDDGVAVDEVPGPYGTELRARLRTLNGFDDLRFVGVDGPRWMVRAVFQGPAAVDPQAAGLLNECLAGLVVSRDETARPAREPLPLRLPPEMARAAQGQAAPTASAEPLPVDPPVAEPEPVPRRRPSPRPRRD